MEMEKKYSIAYSEGWICTESKKCVSDRVSYFDTEQDAKNFIEENQQDFCCDLYVELVG